MGSRYFQLVILLTFFFYSSIFSQNYNEDILNEISEILEDEYFNSTTIALSIFDLTANEVLYNKDEKKLLHPASNMKVITSVAALEYLDPEYTFNTSAYHTGIIMDSICYGDIIIVGGFDPDFTTKDLDTLVYSLIDYGIKEIRGNIYGDVSNMDSLFWGNGWMWDDDPYPDFPYMTPLIINDVSIEIAYAPGLIGNPAHYELIPQTNYFDVTNNSITTREDTSNFEISRDWLHRGNELVISGDLSYKTEPDTVKINVVNPEYYFLYLFKEKLEENSIEIIGRIDTLTLPEYSKLIYTHSRKFSEVIVNLNKDSDNLSSEMTLRAMSFENYGKPASAEKGIQVIDSMISRTGLNFEDYKIVDGSGVSHYNLVSTELMIELLKYMYYRSSENYKILHDSFPIAGVDGTLENRMRRTKAFENVHAKTGTLSGVSTLSGYLKSANDHDITFSIFFQNYIGSSRVVRRYQDRICKFLSELVIK